MNALAQFPVQASGPRLDNRRIAAGVVDLAVVGLFGLVLRAAAGGQFTASIAAVTIAWGLFYHYVAEAHWQQTLGKRLLGLRVQAQGGGVPDDRAIALRTVLRVVDGIAFYLVGLLVMLRTGERRQRLGDIVGATEVVDARQPASPTVKSTLRARDVGAPEPGEVPASVFEHDREVQGEVALQDDLDESAGAEIVSEPVDEPEPEPDLPAAAEEPEPELPRAEEPEPEPEEEHEPQLPTSMDDEPEPEDEPEADPDGALPRVSSPAIEELAGDVASSASKPGREPREKPSSDEDITVKPVETVSPMDLVMGDTEPEPEQASERSRAGSRDN
ncbi:MAG: RDD family protein [Thermoleophilaceae bacterium]|nr:RDD family protein [Thermoleophilaceae bacterium]